VLRSGVFSVILMFVPMLTPSAQQECGCASVDAPCSAYWNGAAVFVGRVESVARETAGRRVTFAVLESFLGAASSTIDVRTGPAGQSCSVAFKIGREYLVYASRADGSSALMTTTCTRTREIEDAGADLAYARSVKNAAAPAGRITGQVVIGRRDLVGKTLRVSEPLSGATVRVIKDGVASIAATNEAGDFAVESRGAGRYDVRVDVPDGYYADDPSSAVELRDPRGCRDVRVTLYPNGIVSGRVVDAAGRPLPGLTIDIATTTLAQRRKTITDREGRYEIAHLPPGKFVVGTNTAPQKSAGHQARAFHPGVESVAAASRVALERGQRVALDDFRIPSRMQFVSVSGFVLDADGTAAEGARVYLRGVAEGDHIVAEPAVVDFLGRFVIAAVANVEYEIFAERSRSRRTDSTEPVRLTASDRSTPLRLILRRRY
jgi:hypothetical protein